MIIGGASIIADSGSASVDYTLFHALNGLAGRSSALERQPVAHAVDSIFTLLRRWRLAAPTD